MFTVRPLVAGVTTFEEPGKAYVLLDGEDLAREFDADTVEVTAGESGELLVYVGTRIAGHFPRKSVLWWLG